VETLTYSSGRASGCDSPGLLNTGVLSNFGPAPFHGTALGPFLISCFRKGSQ
jgi:hypothetical protein